MNKIKILLMIVFCVFLAPSVYAGTAYVDSINIEAKINIDGSMKVKETILWDIEEDLNGVYRDILITNPSNELNSASGIVIESVIVDGKEFEYSYNTLKNGTNGKYNINEIDGGKQVKIFTPSSDEYRKTVITYTLRDVIVKYNDIAELYWNFIGKGWDYGIYEVSINIKLPGSPEILKVFAHGPLHGYSSIPTLDSAMLKVDDLRSGEQVDVRLLFDASLIDTYKIVYEDRLDDILAKEEQLAIEANLKRENAKKALSIAIVIEALALIIPIFVYFRVRSRSYKATFKGEYYRELPEDYGPAVMNKVIHGINAHVSSYDMLATLLDLVRRKYVKIEPIYKKNKKKPDDYNLKLINTDLKELNVSEQHFVTELIFVDTTEIALKELSKKNSRSIKAKTKAMESYTKWGEILEDVAKEKELIKKEKIKVGKDIIKCVISFVIYLIVIVFGSLLGYDDIIIMGIFGILFAIYEVVFFGILITDLAIRTQKGVEHKAMWKAFKKFLQDFSKLDEHDYKSIAIWEHYLVYATALGVSKKVIKQLKIVFPTEFEENSNTFGTYMTISLLSDSNAFSNFESSFSSATSTAFSAPSSSTGSGGGFSGGAGGRRWRWRRWRILASKIYSN